MYAQVEKMKENKGRKTYNSIGQRKNNRKQGFGFVDTRAEVITQRKPQEIINNNLQMMPLRAHNIFEPVQRYVQVNAEEREDSVVITATGEVKDFKDGDSAEDNGWNNVEKYKADAYIDKKQVATTGGYVDNTYRVAQAGHVLAEQNGGLGSDSENVFAQDGGMNNGWYRSNFENPMRAALNKANKKDNVFFRAVLWGEDIENGKLAKEADNIVRSDEETDFEMSEDSDG